MCVAYPHTDSLPRSFDRVSPTNVVSSKRREKNEGAESERAERVELQARERERDGALAKPVMQAPWKEQENHGCDHHDPAEGAKHGREWSPEPLDALDALEDLPRATRLEMCGAQRYNICRKTYCKMPPCR